MMPTCRGRVGERKGVGLDLANLELAELDEDVRLSCPSCSRSSRLFRSSFSSCGVKSGGTVNPRGRKDVLPLPLRLRQKREGGGGGGGGGVAVAVELSEVDCGAATTASVAAARRLARCEAAAAPAMTTTRERDARIAVEAAGRVIGVAIESEEEKEETNDEWRELSRSPHFPPPFFVLAWEGRETGPPCSLPSKGT
jgi:hypothetical protein